MSFTSFFFDDALHQYRLRIVFCVLVLVYVALQEQKRSLPALAVKPRASQTSLANAVPDVLACMLKDTTSEHKTHLFDLKCKICTGKFQKR